jgi:hypothetical protein
LSFPKLQWWSIQLYPPVGLLALTASLVSPFPLLHQLYPLSLDHFTACVSPLSICLPLFPGAPRVRSSTVHPLPYAIASLFVFPSMTERYRLLSFPVLCHAYDVLSPARGDCTFVNGGRNFTDAEALVTQVVLCIRDNVELVTTLNSLLILLDCLTLPSPLFSSPRITCKAMLIARVIGKAADLLNRLHPPVDSNAVVFALDRFLVARYDTIVFAVSHRPLTATLTPCAFIPDGGSISPLRLIKSLFYTLVKLSPDQRISLIQTLRSSGKYEPVSREGFF